MTASAPRATSQPVASPPGTPRGSPLLGVACVLGGAFALSVSDMSVKFLSGGYPLHEVILIRSLIGICFVVGVILFTRTGLRQLRTRRPVAHLIRVGFILMSNVTYYLGLAVLPLADGVAIAFIGPLAVTALSAVVLGEQVGARRWIAVLVGLVGVIVMVRPGSGLIQTAALLVAFSAVSYSCAHIMTRRMRTSESAIALGFYGQAGFIAASALMGLSVGDGRMASPGNATLDYLFRAWVWPSSADWPYFVCTGIAVATAGILIAQAYRLSTVATVAPFEYAAMPLAILWGVLIFGQWPDPTAWIGIELICGAGLFALTSLRE
ncbi:MAG: Membrane protein [Rhodobacteraceae bacterium]|nr:MAG: Membrane protein [Paracoccaceae bacterium]